MLKARARFDQSAADVANKLVAVVESPNFLMYSEKASHQLNSAALLRSRDVFVILREFQYNLAFSRTMMVNILKELDARSTKWEFTKAEDLETWLDTMQARIRAACRHIQQARVKNPSCTWLRELFGDVHQLSIPESWRKSKTGDTRDSQVTAAAEPVLSDDPDEASCTAAVAVPTGSVASGSSRQVAVASAGREYLIGWCPEQKKAWRKGSAQLALEYTDELFVGADSEVRARWAIDGYEHTIPELTVEELAAMQFVQDKRPYGEYCRRSQALRKMPS